MILINKKLLSNSFINVKSSDKSFYQKVGVPVKSFSMNRNDRTGSTTAKGNPVLLMDGSGH
jgi:hypothetical protein